MSPDMSDVMRPPTIAELFPGIEALMPNEAAVAMILADAKHLPGDVTFAFGAYVGDLPRDVVREAAHAELQGRAEDPRVKMYVDRVVAGDAVCRGLMLALRAGELSIGALPASMNAELRRWLLAQRFENLWCGGRRGAIGTMTSLFGKEPCRTCLSHFNHTLTCPEW